MRHSDFYVKNCCTSVENVIMVPNWSKKSVEKKNLFSNFPLRRAIFQEKTRDKIVERVSLFVLLTATRFSRNKKKIKKQGFILIFPVFHTCPWKHMLKMSVFLFVCFLTPIPNKKQRISNTTWSCTTQPNHDQKNKNMYIPVFSLSSQNKIAVSIKFSVCCQYLRTCYAYYLLYNTHLCNQILYKFKFRKIYTIPRHSFDGSVLLYIYCACVCIFFCVCVVSCV